MRVRHRTLGDLADRVEHRSLGDLIVDRAVHDEARHVWRVELGAGDVNVATGTRALTTSSSAGALLSAAQPQFAAFERHLSLRDVVPSVPTTAPSVPFPRELNPVQHEGGASGVPEGNLKPDVGGQVAVTSVLVTPGVLAANVTPTVQLWDDSEAFVTYINGRLPYQVRVRETVAAIAGTGSAADGGIVGLSQTTGVDVLSGSGGGLVAAITAGTQDVTGKGAMPDAVFCNSFDLVAALATNPNFFLALEDVLGMVVIPMADIPKGWSIVGDFGTGAVLVDRQQTTIEVYDQHADYAAKGLVLVQAEERVGFGVLAPWKFAVVEGL